MNLAVLGSGSRGNAIVIAAGGDALLIDAGFGLRTLRKRLRAVGVRPEIVRAVVVTHEHADHSRGAGTLAAALGCPLVATKGTLHALRDELDQVETLPLAVGCAMRVGCLAVDACATLHDAAEPVAVRVSHPASGQRYGIACDVGHVTPDLAAFLRGCTGLVLEANHDADMLASGPYPPALQARIAGRLGHLSNAAAARLAASLAHAGLSFVVLAHLSEQCNRPDLARRVVADALARCQFSGALLVAHQDRPLPVVPLRVEPQYSLQLH